MNVRITKRIRVGVGAIAGLLLLALGASSCMSTLYTVSAYEGGAASPHGVVYRLPETLLRLDADIQWAVYDEGPYYCYQQLLNDPNARFDLQNTKEACARPHAFELRSANLVEQSVPSNRDVFVFDPRMSARNHRSDVSVELTSRGIIQQGDVASFRIAGGIMLKMTGTIAKAAAALAPGAFGAPVVPSPLTSTDGEALVSAAACTGCANTSGAEQELACNACYAAQRFHHLEQKRGNARTSETTLSARELARIEEEQAAILKAFSRIPQEPRVETVHLLLNDESSTPSSTTKRANLCLNPLNATAYWSKNPCDDVEEAYEVTVHPQPYANAQSANEGRTCCHNAADMLNGRCGAHNFITRRNRGVVYRVPQYGDVQISLQKNSDAEEAETTHVHVSDVEMPGMGCYAMAPNRTRGGKSQVSFKIDERTGVLTSFKMKSEVPKNKNIEEAMQPINETLQQLIERQNATEEALND